MKNTIWLHLHDNKVYFTYKDKKSSEYTWHFDLDGGEEQHNLFRTLCNHYAHHYHADLIVNTTIIKTLKKFRWL